MTNFLWLYINKCKVASLCSVPVVIEMAAEDKYIAGWLSKLQCDCPQLTILADVMLYPTPATSSPRRLLMRVDFPTPVSPITMLGLRGKSL